MGFLRSFLTSFKAVAELQTEGAEVLGMAPALGSPCDHHETADPKAVGALILLRAVPASTRATRRGATDPRPRTVPLRRSRVASELAVAEVPFQWIPRVDAGRAGHAIHELGHLGGTGCSVRRCKQLVGPVPIRERLTGNDSLPS